MPFLLETGSGLRNSNSYTSVTFADEYLADRNRSAENDWSTQTTATKQAALMAATQYIDSIFGTKFKGEPLSFYAGVNAVGRITLVGAQADTETFTIGNETYTVVAALDDLTPNQILANADPATFAASLQAAIQGNSSGSGVTHSQYTVVSDSVNVSVSSNVLTFTAKYEGSLGNEIALASSNGSNTVVGFQNGKDEGLQALAFPRTGALDAKGNRVIGIPLKLQQATVEYAVRSLSAKLATDPTVDATGRTVTKIRSKAGPVESEKEFSSLSDIVTLIKPYPEADNLLKDFINGSVSGFVSGSLIRA